MGGVHKHMITKEELINIGKIKGLENKEYIEKSYFQDLFLFNLYRESNIFVFKGGTALYKIYNLQRFSEDLDFSLIGEKEEAKEIIKKVVDRIDGFSIKEIKEVKESILIKISCRGLITKYNALRIDISLKNKIFLPIDVKNYVSDYLDIPPFSLKVLNPEEIVSEKIHSMLNRRKARDLYDLFFLLKQFKFNEKITKEKLKLFNQEYYFEVIRRRITELKNFWKPELDSFVLGELPDFELVKNYVLKKLSKKLVV